MCRLFHSKKAPTPMRAAPTIPHPAPMPAAAPGLSPELGAAVWVGWLLEPELLTAEVAGAWPDVAELDGDAVNPGRSVLW